MSILAIILQSLIYINTLSSPDVLYQIGFHCIIYVSISHPYMMKIQLKIYYLFINCDYMYKYMYIKYLSFSYFSIILSILWCATCLISLI